MITPTGSLMTRVSRGCMPMDWRSSDRSMLIYTSHRLGLPFGRMVVSQEIPTAKESQGKEKSPSVIRSASVSTSTMGRSVAVSYPRSKLIPEVSWQFQRMLTGSASSLKRISPIAW